MAYSPLPQYEAGRNALLDFAPLERGFKAVGETLESNRRKDQFSNALASARGMQGIDPAMLGLAETLGPDHGPNALFGAYNNAQQRAIADRQFGEQVRMHNQTLALQRQQEARQAAMMPYDIAQKKASSENTAIDTLTKQRDLDTPKNNLQKIKDDERLIQVDPRTGASKEVVGASNDGGYKSIKDRVEVEGHIRKEFTAQAKPFVEVRDAYNRVETAARNPSPAGDMSLIFNFMKILDPGSVVREGEFATAQNATGVPDRILNMYNRVASGERLNPAQRSDFVMQSRQLYATQLDQHNNLKSEYDKIARDAKINPDRVGIKLDSTGMNVTRSPAPQVGYDARTKQFNYMSPDSGEWQSLPGAKSVSEAEQMAARAVQRKTAPQQPTAQARPAAVQPTSAPSAPAAQAAPAPGTVMDGHRFKGGDPSRPESWEKV